MERILAYPGIPPNEIITWISEEFACCGSAAGSQWAASEEFEDRVSSWCKWFDETHPTKTNSRVMTEYLPCESDFRIFSLAFSMAGACL
jgi:hypothetical protein